MYRPVRGILRLREEYAQDLMRLCRVAELIDPGTGQSVEGVLPLYDAQLIAADGFSWTLTGFERFWDAGRLIDYAQTWLVDPAEQAGQAPLIKLTGRHVSQCDDLRTKLCGGLLGHQDWLIRYGGRNSSPESATDLVGSGNQLEPLHGSQGARAGGSQVDLDLGQLTDQLEAGHWAKRRRHRDAGIIKRSSILLGGMLATVLADELAFLLVRFMELAGDLHRGARLGIPPFGACRHEFRLLRSGRGHFRAIRFRGWR